MNQKLVFSLLLVGVSALFFLPFLGGVRLFDWDEINFAEAAREMTALGDYGRVHIDYQPFYEKPPLFFWLQAFWMNVFGVSEFTARLPNALCGIVTLVYLYHIGTKLHGHRFGVLWSLAYLGSVLPHLYFRSGIIDPVFNLFIFISLVNLIFAAWKREELGTRLIVPRREWTYLIIGGVALGLAILTKGPVALLVLGLTVLAYWLLGRLRWFLSVWQGLIFLLVASVLPLAWVGLEVQQHGPEFINAFIAYSIRLLTTPDAGHGGFPGYHVIILLVGCFPASIFALRAFRPLFIERNFQRDFRRWMIILFGVVLVLFTVVQSKIVHYSSLCYFPITYLAALTLTQIEERKIPFGNYLRAGLIAVGSIYVLATIAAPILAQRMDIVKQFADQDPFTQGNLNAPVNWTGWEVLPGIWLLGLLAVTIYWFRHRQVARAATVLFVGMAAFVTLTLWFFIGRIEGLSQATAMRYFEQAQGKDVYVKTYGYHSYGPFFYTRKSPVTNPKSYNQDWLLHGRIDKDVWFIRKSQETPTHLDSLPDVRKTGERNGFVFYLRKAK